MAKRGRPTGSKNKVQTKDLLHFTRDHTSQMGIVIAKLIEINHTLKEIEFKL